jgi:hypothetical protein
MASPAGITNPLSIGRIIMMPFSIVSSGPA